MVSAISAMSAMRYTMMANNSAYNMMRLNSARMGLLSNAGNVSFGSLGALAAMDTQYELDMITNSLQYKMSKAMLEQIKKQQKEDAKRFSVFA